MYMYMVSIIISYQREGKEKKVVDSVVLYRS